MPTSRDGKTKLDQPLAIAMAAALTVIVSALISGWMIWRNLAHLDMVAVLKTKE